MHLETINLAADPLGELTRLGNGVDYRLLKMGKRDVFLLNAPDLIQWGFTSKAVGRGRFFKVFSRWLGEGLLTVEGEAHRASRRMMLDAFTKTNLAYFLKVMKTEIERTLAGWPVNEPVNLLPALRHLALRAVTKSLYGLERMTPADEDEILEIIVEGSEAFLGRHSSMREGHYLKDGRLRHPAVDTALEFMMKNWQATPLTQVLDTLPDSTRYDHTLTMLNASLDTTLAAIGWLFVLFDKNPETFFRFVNDELARAFPDTGELDQDAYIHLAVQETLRIYPTGGWLNTREVFEPVTVRDLELPAGMNVFMSSWITHRDARYFEHPESFRPERFLTHPTPWTYFPFGGGPHLCIGRSFTMGLIPLLASMTVRKFNIEFLPDNHITTRIRIGLTPEGNLQAILRKREV